MHPFTSTLPAPALYMPYTELEEEEEVIVTLFTSTVPVPTLYIPYPEV